MMLAKASAPGKVIVAGEYAVLDGAPAICMAVNRRARVSISLNDEPEHVVSAPGFLEKPQRFASMTDCADTLPLLWAVWNKSEPAIDGCLNIDIDSREFVAANGRKIGIGSSAAVAVALSAAIEQIAAGGRDIRDVAIAAHRDFQGGSGSGADIACSHAGGVIVYRKEEKMSQPIAWPADLYFALLWSGCSADTAKKLNKLANSDSHDSRTELATASDAVSQLWQSGDAASIVSLMSDYTKTLLRFDVDHQLGIFDAGHAQLVDAASQGDVAYKPCGAGGGDLGIAVSANESALSGFVDDARQQGFELLELSIDATGVAVEGTKQ